LLLKTIESKIPTIDEIESNLVFLEKKRMKSTFWGFRNVKLNEEEEKKAYFLLP
jgi:hypothetical protein